MPLFGLSIVALAGAGACDSHEPDERQRPSGKQDESTSFDYGYGQEVIKPDESNFFARADETINDIQRAAQYQKRPTANG